jgi:peptide deformylase
MAILPIIEAPHPILSARARPVLEDEFDDDLAVLLDDMAETMYAAPGVGLAAPQVLDGRRILVIDPGFEGEDGEAQKGIFLMKMINPEILEKSDERITWEESCLSVPEYAVNVKRSRRIRVRWRDAAGETMEQEFFGFPAVVVQHEMDHLEGKTLLDHSSRLKRGRYIKRMKKLRSGG